ncbi:hypothetical protein EMPS_02882 [Entomortierella parvispora]|uniref:Uncharacterized protein n=1 Tax=Entomortierella parvispora TaxID=205924 RepID=A0A9P3H5R5_9FUNG|nr:hypothetical protein EMPS_02882 [Entomortierella parvispora]
MSQDTHDQDHHRFGQDDDGDEGPSPPSYEEAISQDLSSADPVPNSRTIDDPLQGSEQGTPASSFALPSAPTPAQVQQPSAPPAPPSSNPDSATGIESAPNHDDTHSAHQQSHPHPSHFGHRQGPFSSQHHDPLGQFQDPFMRHRHHQHPLAHPQLHQGPYKHPSFPYGPGPSGSSSSSPSSFPFATSPPSTSEASGEAAGTAPASHSTSESSFSEPGNFGGMPRPPSSFPSFPPFPGFPPSPFGGPTPPFPGFGRGPLPEGGIPGFVPGMGPGPIGRMMGPMPVFPPPGMHAGFIGSMPTASPHLPATSGADQTSHIPTGGSSGSSSIDAMVPPAPPRPPAPAPPVPPMPTKLETEGQKAIPTAPPASEAPPISAFPGIPPLSMLSTAGSSSSAGNEGSSVGGSGSNRFAHRRGDSNHLPTASAETSAFSAASVTGPGFGYPPLVPTEPLGALSAAQTSTAGLVKAQDISQALIKRKAQGVIESQDALLEDPFQLYRFFVAHNDKPSMHVLITGSHVEKRTSEKKKPDGTTQTVQQKVKVHDFKIDFDLTPYINASGTITTLPDPQSGKRPTLREVMEEHVEDENPFKKLYMPKKINWDYEDLTRAITHAIRSVNYRYMIEISYPVTNHMVQVKSSSPLATFVESSWATSLFVSCFGFVFYPVRAMVNRVKDKTIQSEFDMTITTREFFLHNYWSIIDQVKYKS